MGRGRAGSLLLLAVRLSLRIPEKGDVDPALKMQQTWLYSCQGPHILKDKIEFS